MAKYSPSIKNNNDLRDKAVNEINAFIYLVDNKRINSQVKPDELISAIKGLKDSVRDLENAYGTGKEDIGLIYERIHGLLTKLQKSAQTDNMHRISPIINDINNNVNEWKDVLDGRIMPTHNIAGTKKDKRKRAVRKLDKKLAELADVIGLYDAFISDSDNEINMLKKDQAIYEDQLIEAEDELLINDIARKLDGVDYSIATKSVRKDSYSECRELLSKVYENANQYIMESAVSKEQLNKARAFLDVKKLKSVLTEPQRAVSVIKQMSKDVESISRGSSTIKTARAAATASAQNAANASQHRPYTTTESTTLSADPAALARKEALMQKRRASEANKKMKEELSNLDNSASATDVKKTEQV